MLKNTSKIISLGFLTLLIVPTLALAQISIETTQPEDAETTIITQALEETESDLAEKSEESTTEEIPQVESEVSNEELNNNEDPELFQQAFDLMFSENLSITDELNGKNLYAFGGELGIYQDVKGDLLGAAGTLTIDANIEEDAFLVAGDLYINSDINGDLRAVAGDISINGLVNGDLMLGAGNVRLSPTSSLKGDGIINAGNVVVEGPIEGNLIINASHVQIASEINGNLKINADSIEFLKDAKVNGNLTYKAITELDRTDKYVSGEVKFNQIASSSKSSEVKYVKNAFLSFKKIMKLLIGLLIISFLTLIFSNHLPKLAKLALKEPLMKSVLGLTAIISTPIIAFLLLIAAFPVSLGIFLTYALVILLAHYLGAIFVGSFIFKRAKGMKTYQFTVQSSMLGYITIELIEQLPYYTGHILLVFLLFYTFGTLLNYLFNGLGFKAKK